jgi:hypothetical protein
MPESLDFDGCWTDKTMTFRFVIIVTDPVCSFDLGVLT